MKIFKLSEFRVIRPEFIDLKVQKRTVSTSTEKNYTRIIIKRFTL